MAEMVKVVKTLKLKPNMSEFIADASLYSLYNILPVGWRRVKHETTGIRRPLCAKEKRTQQIEMMKNGLSKKDMATLTFERESIGPFRERKVFTYGDGRVLTVEKHYESWELEEFWDPKTVYARMNRDDSISVVTGVVEEINGDSEDSMSTSQTRSSTSSSQTSSVSSVSSQKRSWWSWPVLKPSSKAVSSNLIDRLLGKPPKLVQGRLTERESP